MDENAGVRVTGGLLQQMLLAPSISQAPRPIAIASFKAFGDFVIVHSIVSAIREHRNRVRILAGSHLDALAEIMPGGVTVTRVELRDQLVPPLFDARLRGPAAALRSGLELRKALTRVERRPHETLVVDRACWRSRWIGRSWPVVGVHGVAPNVYAGYARSLDERGFPVSLDSAPHPLRGRRVGVFPGSRLARKAIPADVLHAIVRAIEAAGFSANVIRIDGEAPIDGVPFTTIPRTFRNLLDALASVDVVVSADSLPAHLGECFGRRVFVASPTPNHYWLPHRCFANGHCALFAAPDLETALRRFLDGPVVRQQAP